MFPEKVKVQKIDKFSTSAEMGWTAGLQAAGAQSMDALKRVGVHMLRLFDRFFNFL